MFLFTYDFFWLSALAAIIMLVLNSRAKRNNYPKASLVLLLFFLTVSLVAIITDIGLSRTSEAGPAIIILGFYVLSVYALPVAGLIIAFLKNYKSPIFILLFVLISALPIIPIYIDQQEKVNSGEIGGISQDQAVSLARQRLDNNDQNILVNSELMTGGKGAARVAVWHIVFSYTKPDGSTGGSHFIDIDAKTGEIRDEKVYPWSN